MIFGNNFVNDGDDDCFLFKSLRTVLIINVVDVDGVCRPYLYSPWLRRFIYIVQKFYRNMTFTNIQHAK